MLKHFYRLMVVALGFFVASSCGKSEPMYGIQQTDFDDGTVDEDVADVAVDEDLPPDEDAVDAEGLDSDAEIPDEDMDEDEYADETLYGCPAVDYLIEGTVAAVGGAPIPGIEISSDLYYRTVPKVTTGGDGTFSITANDECSGPQEMVMLYAKDVDGAANGQYQDNNVYVPLNCTYDDNGLGYYNCSNTDVKIELEEVSSDDDTLVND